MNEHTPTATSGSKEISPLRMTDSDGEIYDDESRYQHEKAPAGSDKVWLQRLADLFQAEVYPSSLDTHTMVLGEFPNNYHLRVSYRDKNKKGRHDFYLYGYPEKKKGEKLRYYRSPNEFFPHFMWISRGPGRRDDCFCKHCIALKDTQAPAKKSASVTTSEPPTQSTRKLTNKFAIQPMSLPPTTSSTTFSAQPVTQPVAQPVAQHGSQYGFQAAQPVAPPINKAVNPATSRSQTSTVGAPRTPYATQRVEPTVRFQPDEAVLFREGEVVWFRTDSGAFRLGVVLRNLPSQPSNGLASQNLIKPLSHYGYPIPDIVRFEADMRPFLTFSIPGLQRAAELIANQPMETVDWGAIETQIPYDLNMRAEVLSMEASKIAASRTDHSYSLFNYVREIHPNQRSFEGVFLGCEKMGIFEAVRVRVEAHEHPHWENNDFTFTMTLKGIILQQTAERENLVFSGDLWLLQEVPISHPTPNPEQLPAAMKREKAFRDKVKAEAENRANRACGSRFDWILVKRDVIKPERSIRGRFYESQKLGPALIPDWEHNVLTGDIPPIQRSLNNRFDSRSDNIDYIGRKNSRGETFAGAVPTGTVMSFGPHVLEWPPALQ